MESIMKYGSDSHEESDEDTPEGAISECSSFSYRTHPQEPVHTLFPRQRTLDSDPSETSEKSTVSFNFLGLQEAGKSSSYTFNYSQANNDLKESRKMQTSCGDVEIPSGDFWRNFTPDYSSVVPTQGADIPGCQQVQAVSASVTDTNLIFSHQNSLKRLHCGTKFGNTGSEEVRDKQSRLSVHGSNYTFDSKKHPHDLVHRKHNELPYSSKNRQSQDIDHTECPNNSLGMQTLTNEKRKLYYVHSKVAPYLNVKPVNKCAGKLQSSWPSHDGVVNRLAWNVPNFSHLLLTAGMDTSMRVWNVWSGVDLCVAKLSGHKKAVKHAEWCQAGRSVLSCSFDRTAQVTDVETAKTLGQYEHMSFVTAGHMHPSNPNLFVTGTDNMILKWDVRTPQAPVRCFSYKDNFGQVQDLLFISHGQEFVTCSDLVSRDCADRSVMVWDFRTGTVLSNQIFQERYVCSRLQLHPNNTVFMAQTHAGYVALFSTTSPYKMDKSKRYEGHKVQGHNIGFDISPDGSMLYSGSAGNGIHCYHQLSGRLIRKLSSGRDVVTDVACHPVLPSLLASCTWGGSVSLWV